MENLLHSYKYAALCNGTTMTKSRPVVVKHQPYAAECNPDWGRNIATTVTFVLGEWNFWLKVELGTVTCYCSRVLEKAC